MDRTRLRGEPSQQEERMELAIFAILALIGYARVRLARRRIERKGWVHAHPQRPWR